MTEYQSFFSGSASISSIIISSVFNKIIIGNKAVAKMPKRAFMLLIEKRKPKIVQAILQTDFYFSAFWIVIIKMIEVTKNSLKSVVPNMQQSNVFPRF